MPGRPTFPTGLQGSPGSSGAPSSLKHSDDIESIAPLRSGRERAAAARVWAAPSFQVKEGGVRRLARALPCRGLAGHPAGWRDCADSGLASDGFPCCSWSLGLSLLCPCSLLCSATQALCLGWLHSIPYPNPGTASQALSSPAPGCWSHPEPLPPPTPMPALPSCF